MLYIIFFTIVAVLYLLVYRILYYLLAVEDRSTLKKYANTKTKRSVKSDPRHIFKKYIIVPVYKKEEMERSFYSLNISKTAEEYYSENLYYCVLPLVGSICALLLGQFIVAIILLSIAAIIYQNKNGRLYRALNYRKINIEEEAPAMIRFFISEISNHENIKVIFEKYHEISKYLKPDIEKTILDMNAITAEKDVMLDALHKLDERLNIQITRDFITGLIDSLSGKDQVQYFDMLERDLKILSIKNLERRAAKVDSTVRISMFIIIFAYIFFMTGMIIPYMANFMK